MENFNGPEGHIVNSEDCPMFYRLVQLRTRIESFWNVQKALKLLDRTSLNSAYKESIEYSVGFLQDDLSKQIILDKEKKLTKELNEFAKNIYLNKTMESFEMLKVELLQAHHDWENYNGTCNTCKHKIKCAINN